MPDIDSLISEVDGICQKQREEEIQQDIQLLMGEYFDSKTLATVCRQVINRSKVLEAFLSPWADSSVQLV